MNARKLTRRDTLRFAPIVLYLLYAHLVLRRWRTTTLSAMPVRPRKIGTTFSQLQCRYLELDYKDTFREVVTLGLDYIRLAAYWDEIEPLKGHYEFSTLDWLIDRCQRHSIPMVITTGMKAPRWPEFHFPDWIEERHNTTRTDIPLDSDELLAERALIFVEKVLDHLKDTEVSYWQVENEALSRPGVASNRYLSTEFVKREIELVRQHRPQQRILLTNSVSLSPGISDDRQALEDSIPLADAIGINVYTRVPINSFLYTEAHYFYWEKLSQWKRELTGSGKEAWVAESQAEPWEWNQLVATERFEYPSTSPETATALAVKLGHLGYQTVLLWGCEYWVWHKKQGSMDWLNAVTALVQSGWA